jgi:GNAT superfamily N-acetyltransferase
MFRDDFYQRLDILCSNLRRAVTTPVRFIQSLSLYRSLGRHIIQHLVVLSFVDANEIEVVFKRLFLVPYEKPTEQNVKNIIAKLWGLSVGVAQLIYNPRDLFTGYWLCSLKVFEPLRGLGIGDALVRFVIENAEERGASELFLLADEDNIPATCLYHKVGFTLFTDTNLETIIKAQKEKRRLVFCKPINRQLN